MKPVDRERLAAIGSGKHAELLKSKMAAFEAKQSPDAQTLLKHGFYKPLLEWTERHAWDVHGVATPWSNDAGS